MPGTTKATKTPGSTSKRGRKKGGTPQPHITGATATPTPGGTQSSPVTVINLTEDDDKDGEKGGEEGASGTAALTGPSSVPTFGAP